MGDNTFIIVIAAVVALFVIFRVIKAIRRVSPSKALQLQENGASIVDVRQPSEFSDGHIAGAVNIPLANLSKITSRIKKDTPVIVYCLSGSRSGSAARQLKSMGYASVYDLGSIGRWPYNKT